MPDFNRLYKKYQQGTSDINQGGDGSSQNGEIPTREDGSVDPTAAMEQMVRQQHEMNNQNQNESTNFDMGAVSAAGDPMKEGARIGQQMTNLRGQKMGQNIREADDYWSHNTWRADDVYKDYAAQVGEGIAFGTGQLIGQYGDLVHALGAVFLDDRDGNVLSRYLQEQGQDIMDNHEFYIPEEVMDPKFSLSTFANPQFWTVHGARFVPQLVEILATGALGSLAKKGVQKGITYGLRKSLQEGSEAMFKKGFAGSTTKSLARKADDAIEGFVQHESQKGKLFNWKKFITDEGKMTKPLSDLVENAASGTITNLRVGLSNAGEMHSTLKDLKDPNGNPLYSDEQLGAMASDAFMNNLSYIGLDIASWSMTFGKGKMRDLGLSTATKKTFNKAQQSKYIGGLVGVANNRILTGVTKLAGKGALEGGEEMIQESWEEYSKLKAIQDNYGDLSQYENGKYLNQLEGDKEGFLRAVANGDFFDFMMSKENEATRTIAFGLGAMAGGAFNIKTAFNKNADKYHKLRMRAEGLKALTKEGTYEKELQRSHMMQQITEIVDEDKGHLFAPFMKAQLEDGVITEEDFEIYNQAYNDVQAERNKIKDLDVKGKSALLQARVLTKLKTAAIEQKEDELRQNVQSIAETFKAGTDDFDKDGYDRAIKELRESYRDELQALYAVRDQHEENAKSLVSGKAAKRNAWRSTWDDDKQRYVFEKVKESENDGEKDPFNAEPDEERETNFSEKVKKKAKEAVDSITGLFNSKRSVTGGPNSDTIEISDISESNAYSREEVVELDKKMKEANLTEKELDNIAKKHGVERSNSATSGGFVGDSKSSIANAIQEKNQIENDRKNKIEREYLENKIKSQKEKDSVSENRIKELDKEIKSLEKSQTEDQIKSSMTSKFAKEFNNDNENASIDDLTKAAQNRLDELNQYIDDFYDKHLEEDGSIDPENISDQELKEFTETREEVIKLVNDLKSVEDDSDFQKHKELNRERGKIAAELNNPTKRKRSRRYKERLGLLNGITIDEQIKQEKAKKRKQKQAARDKAKEESKNNPSNNDELKSKLKSLMKDAVQGTAKMTEDIRSSIINNLEESGVITNRNKSLMSRWIDQMFLEEQMRNRKNKPRTTMKDSERMKAPESGTDLFDYKENEGKEATEKIRGKNVRSRVKDNDPKVKNIERNERKAGTAEVMTYLRNMSRKLNKTSRLAKNKLNRSVAPPMYSADARTTAQEWTVNKKLEEMFPDANVTAHNVDNLYATLGFDDLGLAINTTIFIDSSQWNQGNKTYMHEIGHIFYNLSKGEEKTEKLIDHFIKNEKLLNSIKENYWDQEIIIDTRTGERILLSDLNAFDPENKQEFLSKVDQDVKNGYLERIPDREQTIWMDEMFAYNMEGPLSKEFNIYFEPKNENQRKSILKSWWGWLKERGKKAGLLNMVKTHEEKTREALTNEEQGEYLDLMETTLDKFTTSIKGKPTLARLRFRKELDESIIYGEEFAKIGSKLDKERDYVRSNQFTNSKINKDRRVVITKEEIADFKETQWPSQRAIHAIANKLYKHAVNTNKIDTIHLQGVEKEMYAVVSDQIDNIVHEELQKNEINSSMTTIEDQDYEDQYEVYDVLDDPDIALNENKEKYSAKYQKFAATFVNYYNVFNKQKAILLNDFENMEVADKDDLLDFLNNEAILSDSPIEFIYRLQTSDHPIVKRFMDFLEYVRPQDSHTFLKGMYVVMNNMEETVPMSKFVGKDGKMNVTNALSKRETSRVQGVYEKIKRVFTTRGGRESKPKPYLDGKFMTNLNNSIESIRANDFTRGDLKRVLQFFSSYNVDVDKLIDRGYLVMNGKSYDIKLLTRQFLVSNNAFGDNKTYDKIENIGNVSRNINPFLKAIEATNRMNTSRQTVMDSKGDQVQSTYVKNALLRLKNRMEEDARKMNLSSFLKKYNHGNKSANVANSNVVLKKIHDRVRSGGSIDLHPTTGTSNTVTNNNAVVKSMSNEEKSFDDFLTFMAKPKNSTTYSKDIGRLADSSRAYHLEVPFLDIRKWGIFDQETGLFNTSMVPTEINNAFKAYRAFRAKNNPGKKFTYDQFINGINNAVNDEIEFLRRMHQNSLTANKRQSKYDALNKIFNANGSLKPDGKMIVAQYVANDIVNTISTQQFLFPSFGYHKNDLLKRSKSMASPSFTLGKNVGVETIYFPDMIDDSIMIDGKPLEIGDAANFILQEDAQRMRDYYGSQMKVGHGLKILNSGIEMDNEYFKGENVYDKGFTIELSEEFVQQNPTLRPLYELMKARREKYLETQGGVLNSLDKGMETQIIHAVPLSARKLKSKTKSRKVTFVNRFGEEVTEDVNFESLQFADLIDPNTSKPYPATAKLYNEYMNKANAFLDNVYYTMEENEEAGTSDVMFKGQSGENFGVQQVMDIPKYDAMLSVQMMNFITTNILVNSTNKQAEAILQGLSNLQQHHVSELASIINRNDSQELREFLLNNIDELNVDQTQLASIKTDKLSITTPWVRSLTINTISNILRKKGNKLKADGTVARQIPDFYHNKMTGETSLKHTQIDGNGNVQVGEAVMPKHLRGKVAARRYFSFADKDSMDGADRIFLEKVELEAQDKGLNDIQAAELLMQKLKNRYGKGSEKEIKPLVKNGNIVGAYVEGDKIIATRIPAHGPQSTTVLEVVDFGAGDGFNVQLPKEFSMVNTGGDFDGDQVFIQHANNSKENSVEKNMWNNTFKKMTDYFTTKEMVEESDQGIDFGEDADFASDRIDEVYGETNEDNDLEVSPKAARKDQVNTVESKSIVGIAASMHSLLSLFSNYNTKVTQHIQIDGKVADMFTDNHNESRVLKSARLFNLILDNTKNGYADKLNLNMQTISTAMTLINLGYGLDQVGVILNSDIANKWSQQKASYNNMYLNNDYNEIQVLDKNGQVVKADKNPNIITSGNKVTDLKNQANILQLLQNIEKINDDVRVMNKILSGHNKMERNPFEAESQIAEFIDLLDYNQGSGVEFNENFRKNPRVQNYLKNAKTHLELLRKLDPTYREAGKNVYQKMVDNPLKNTTKQQKDKIKSDVTKMIDSIIFGLNNYSLGDVNQIMNNIVKEVNDYKMKMEEEAKLLRDPKNLNDKDAVRTKYQESLLFNKVLMIKSIGQNTDISLNSEFFQNGYVEETRQIAMQEFSKLPFELQEKILLYDFVKTGWATPNSIIKIAPKRIRNRISIASDNDLVNKLKNNITDDPGIHRAVMANNIETLPFITRPIITRENGNVVINKAAVNSKIKSAVYEFKPFAVRYKDNSDKDVVFEFNGFTDDQKQRLLTIRKYEDRVNLAYKYVVDNSQTTVFNKEDLKNPERLFLTSTGFKNQNVLNAGRSNPSPDNDTQKKKSINKRSAHIRSRSISVDEDYLRFTYKLDFDQFHSIVNRDRLLSYDKATLLYHRYLEDFKEAEKVAKKLVKSKLETMSSSQLMDIYYTHSKKDKLSQAIVLRPIIMEMVNRYTSEQVNLINEKNPDKNYDPDQTKDISLIQKFMISNNIPSDHPAAQALVRHMEVEYKKFLSERNRYMNELNDATDALYKAKRGYNVLSNNVFSRIKGQIKSIFDQVFNNSEKIYQSLYGDLVTYENYVDDNGRKRTRMKYKSKKEVDALYRDGKIIKEQYDFYNVSTKMMEELAPYNAFNKQQDYIPHTAPSTFEKFARRGLLGLIADSKSPDDKIKDVKFKEFVDPVTGEVKENVTFRDINKYILEIGKTKHKNSFKYANLLGQYKLKALKLANKGINEDGSRIQYSDIHIQTVMGDFKLNDFSNERGVDAEMFPSMDLNKAFSDYINSSLITNGNQNFKGLKNLYPLIDGVIHLAEMNSNPNLKSYVETIWKDYFIKNKRKELLPTNEYFALFNTSPDQIVRFGLKSSMLYWLGIKGLIGAGGSYAIGNVLAGKYFNIKNQGTKSWAKGEKRFWMGSDGVSITNPFKGVKESVRILNRIGYMDVNIYDDVPIYKKNDPSNILTEAALLPMIWSEKWIQGVNFLGLLTEEEYQTIAKGGRIDPARMAELENLVKQNHGKGYQPTDQRMIQMFSLGQVMMQFSRHIPTIFHDSFAKKDFNIYGTEDEGSSRALVRVLMEYISGFKSQKNFKEFFNNLDETERKRTISALRGLGMMSLAWAGSELGDIKAADRLLHDVNAPFDYEKLSWKVGSPPLVAMINDRF